MTNQDRLISLMGFAPANKNAALGAMLDRGIDPEAAYDPSTIALLKAAAIEVMETLLTTADISNENGYKIAYDRDAVLSRIEQLKGELGLIDKSLPYITSRSVW